jgi:hypothetical protein
VAAGVAAACLIAAAPHVASADETASATPVALAGAQGAVQAVGGSSDQFRIPTAPEESTGSLVQGVDAPPDHPYLSVGIVGGIYGVLYGYTYLAWYLRSADNPTLQFHDEGFFGVHTYAGGADKLGHAWSNYALVRGVAGIMEWGGYSKPVSLVTSSSLAMGFFLMSEIKDGYAKDYGFSWADIAANTSGEALGVLMELSPTIDRMFDFRVEYFPSKPYIKSISKKGPFNAAEDYTGQRFLLAYHLSSIDALQDSRYTSWLQYVDVAAGFHAAHYKPEDTDSEPHTQSLFVGVTLNLQRFVDNNLYPKRGERRFPSTGARALHMASEIVQMPYTLIPVGSVSRSIPDPEPEATSKTR